MKAFRVLKYCALCCALIFLAAAIIIYPERYVSCCFDGFALWAECVLPSLFPFMVITLIFIKSGMAEKAALPLKRVTSILSLPPAAAVCFVMSICSGYPAGARALSEFYENGCVDKRDCAVLAALCSTSGPLFITGSVGIKMLGSKTAGWILLAAHALSVLLVALIIAFALRKKSNLSYRRAPVAGNVLYDCFYGAVTSVAVAGGFIAFFCVAARAAQDFNLLYPLERLLLGFTGEEAASAVCRGLIEATAGCAALSATGDKLTLPFTGLLITFGGLSIILQQLSYLSKTGVKPAYFICVKFIQGVLCFLILLPFV